MRDEYIGYYRPTEAEFSQLWKECVFAFDASALLDIYRSTAATRGVVLAFMEALKDRIWLPYQAGYDFQENRLNVISEELTSYTKVAEFLRSLGEQLKSQIHRHSLEVGDELVKELTEVGESLAKRVEEVKLKQPDLVKSDDIRDKITELFAGRVGKKFNDADLAELYKQGERRYESKIPPGYLDSKKPSPNKFGDFIIWSELLQHAKSPKKPIVFITADAKDDWWWQHLGQTIGPRPELVQEMMTEAGTRFYMYDLQQFIDIASKVQKLNITEQVVVRAAEEFKDIRQTREPAIPRGPSWTDFAAVSRVLGREPTDWEEELKGTPLSSWKRVPSAVYADAVSALLGREINVSEKSKLDQALMSSIFDDALKLKKERTAWDLARVFANWLGTAPGRKDNTPSE